MRIVRRYKLFIVLLLFWAFPAYSQSISFTRVAPPKEAPFELITGITQDTTGYMGFTSGAFLYRYNGYEFTTYRNNILNPNSMAGDHLECIYADISGFLWIGDLGDGLDRLDPQTGNFKHYRHDNKDASSLSNDSVVTMTEDHDPAAMGNNYVQHILKDRQGNIC